MKKRLLLIAILAFGAIASQAASPKSEGSPDVSAAFARLKSLVGEWETDLKSGKAHLSYELVAGGTTLLERETADGRATMLTLYHLDGGRLMLTHYCMVGNQPRMVAKTFSAGTGELDFQFLDATGLSNARAGHMHNAKIRFVDNNHVVSEWQFYEDGKPKFSETAEYTRVR